MTAAHDHEHENAPNRFVLFSDRQIETDLGEIQYDDVLAVIETNLSDPGTLARMMQYGQVRIKRVQPGDECPACVGTRQEPVEPEPEPQPEPEAEPEPEPESDPKPEENPLAVLTDHGVDEGTLDALQEAKIESLDELRALMEEGEKIKGIGDKREELLVAAFASMGEPLKPKSE